MAVGVVGGAVRVPYLWFRGFQMDAAVRIKDFLYNIFRSSELVVVHQMEEAERQNEQVIPATECLICFPFHCFDIKMWQLCLCFSIILLVLLTTSVSLALFFTIRRPYQCTMLKVITLSTNSFHSF